MAIFGPSFSAFRFPFPLMLGAAEQVLLRLDPTHYSKRSVFFAV
jgi:hypothetical protein